jgi:hypothetical protein
MLKDGFESFINRSLMNDITISEMLATFTDKILKKSSDRLTETQIEEYLERVGELFEHIMDKDLFSALYSCKLADRLLYESSASSDMEKSFISKMKLRCGS